MSLNECWCVTERWGGENFFTLSWTHTVWIDAAINLEQLTNERSTNMVTLTIATVSWKSVPLKYVTSFAEKFGHNVYVRASELVVVNAATSNKWKITSEVRIFFLGINSTTISICWSNFQLYFYIDMDNDMWIIEIVPNCEVSLIKRIPKMSNLDTFGICEKVLSALWTEQNPSQSHCFHLRKSAWVGKRTSMSDESPGCRQLRPTIYFASRIKLQNSRKIDDRKPIHDVRIVFV